MYHFLQFNPEKKEAWRLYDESQLGSLPKPAAFITVLSVDKDPETVAEQGEDPLDHVKYFGPMYWDFDGPDLDEVLDDVREVLGWLHDKLEIPKELIHCWLSGQKGVHITVPPQVFGVKAPMRALPYYYREIAASKQVETLDMGVYSCGRGRMWRCEGVPRPKTGTFKVGVSFEELETLDAEQYGTLVASPRPKLERMQPSKSLVFPKAGSLFQSAKTVAAKRLRALKNATTVPTEVLRTIEGVPGCVRNLITEGDNPESNWNQAAMQVAAYIAARYERSEAEEYEADIVEPFVVNVESSSRPSEKERRKHVKDQLNRAFSGRTKFYPGALISVIGKACGHCVVCRPELAAADKSEGGMVTFDEETRIKATPSGYFFVNESGMRQLSNWTFEPTTRVFELVVSDTGASRRGDQISMIGTLRDEHGTVVPEKEVETEAWSSKARLISALGRSAETAFLMSEADVQPMLKAIRSLVRQNEVEMKEMIRTKQCGLMFYDSGRGPAPHYVEASGAYARHETESPFKFSGDAKHSPSLLEECYPFENDEELEQTIDHLTRINETHLVAQLLGWAAACHWREHIHEVTGQFPLLNLCGGAGSGKTSTALLVCHLNGIDYGKSPYINCEVSTEYPLTQFVSSSTTVPRMLEEVNPQNMKSGMARAVLGMLKAAWNKASIPKGQVHNGKLGITDTRISAPLLFLSEQGPTEPSIQERTLVTQLSPRTLTDRAVIRHFKAAYAGRASLRRMAKALVTRALNTSPADIARMLDELDEEVPSAFGERPKFCYQIALLGLRLFSETMRDCQLAGSGMVDELYIDLRDYLALNAGVLKREKSRTAVDKVLGYMDTLAGEPEDRHSGLRAGDHYWRTGNALYLVISDCLPRYRRYMVGMSEKVDIKEAAQMASLLEGEIYFDRKESHPHREGVFVHVIDLAKIREKGTPLTNFQDGTEPSEI
ncbi:hypothetical protein D9M70_291200 [compost metagenome]